MRFSKKLLTALLPITAAGVLVPALSSCSKGNGYTINYGDEVNCLDEKGTNYHSIDDVKNVVKNHVPLEQKTEISMGDLPPDWSQATDIQKQTRYYDFIASLTYMENIKFHLIFNDQSETERFTLTYYKDGQPVTVKGKQVYYSVFPDTMKVSIVLQDTSGNDVKCHSYAYQNSKVK